MIEAHDTGSDLPRALLAPSAFPHAVAGPVRLIETHISWVLIAPPFAYKIKRPVAFDFLDFRALADRRRFCEEELRLNRRFTPQLYHDVVPITRAAGGLRIGGSGEVIEYAVRMTAFDPAQELKALLAAGDVHADELVVLAEDLVAFQAGAEPCTAGAAGDPATLDAAAFANFTALRGSPLTAGTDLDALERWTRASAVSLAPLRGQRRAAGFVRDGHGDLHAGNIVRWQGRLAAFDCLEFDARLRCLDVVADVAFLVMDLESRGRPDLAQVFLNAWLAASGDFAALRLLPWHVVYLSLVRAKVDALQLGEATGERAAGLRKRISEHLALALRWAQPSRRGLLLMHGVSGSGKSWLAQRLARLLPAVLVRADVERKRLAGLPADAHTAAGVHEGIYAAAFSGRTYTRLLECAHAALAGGRHVIVDATFLDASRRLPFYQLAGRLGAAPVIVDCAPPPETCHQRVLARQAAGGDPSEAGPAVLADQLARAVPLAAEEPCIHVTGAEPDPAEVARRIRDAVMTAGG